MVFVLIDSVWQFYTGGRRELSYASVGSGS